MGKKLTEAQRSEWEKLIRGGTADADILQSAGLIEFGVEIRCFGRMVQRIEVVSLTPAGRSALAEEERG